MVVAIDDTDYDDPLRRPVLGGCCTPEYLITRCECGYRFGAHTWGHPHGRNRPPHCDKFTPVVGYEKYVFIDAVAATLVGHTDRHFEKPWKERVDEPQTEPEVVR